MWLVDPRNHDTLVVSAEVLQQLALLLECEFVPDEQVVHNVLLNVLIQKADPHKEHTLQDAHLRILRARLSIHHE
jgi:hypothetical protein